MPNFLFLSLVCNKFFSTRFFFSCSLCLCVCARVFTMVIRLKNLTRWIFLILIIFNSMWQSHAHRTEYYMLLQEIYHFFLSLILWLAAVQGKEEEKRTGGFWSFQLNLDVSLLPAGIRSLFLFAFAPKKAINVGSDCIFFVSDMCLSYAHMESIGKQKQQRQSL